MSEFPSPEDLLARPFFFVGVGGSGMLPLGCFFFVWKQHLLLKLQRTRALCIINY